MNANRFVLAVDGGNVKTDLALVDDTGQLLALVRGGGSSPHYVGVDGCTQLLGGLFAEAVLKARLRDAAERAGPDGDGPPRAATAQIMVAGADFPEELAALRAALEQHGWSDRLVLDNDTIALLRSGTDRGWGIAVTCGGGINCIGIAPDRREARFLSLGPISGDWGGGYDVGLSALSAAARSADGRGPKTTLESAVPHYFGLATPFEVARAIHLRELPLERLAELGRVVFPAAAQDATAAAIVGRLADEIAAMAAAAIERLDLAQASPDVVLGGGLVRAAPPSMIERVTRAVREAAPDAHVLVASAPPIVGAALLGLDELGAGPAAAELARTQLGAAFALIEGDGARVVDSGRIASDRHGLAAGASAGG